MSKRHGSQKSHKKGDFASRSPAFRAPLALRNGHLMTVAPLFMQRGYQHVVRESERILVEVEPGTTLLCHVHLQEEPSEKPTLLMLHGLEGSAEAQYILGITYKAWANGFNIVRMNMRNCGGSMAMTRTLYNAGLSGDLEAVVRHLHDKLGLKHIFLGGYSLGGNIVLKLAGELGEKAGSLIRATATVCPALELAKAVEAIETPKNRAYELWFLRTLKQKIVEKAKQCPDLYDPAPLATIKTIREFDDIYTAPSGGYGDAANYYQSASAFRVIEAVQVPSLIIAAADDPLVPVAIFDHTALRAPNFHMLVERHGGHGGFIQKTAESFRSFDKFWAENRMVSFFLEVMSGRIS